VLGQAVSDAMFRAPAALLAEARAVGGSPAATYAYEFRWRSPTQDGLLGACHCLDIPFAFDVLDAEGVEAAAGSDAPQDLAEAMHTAFVAFARSGDPGWPAIDLQRRPTMLFDTPSGVVDDPLGVLRRRWSAVVERDDAGRGEASAHLR
jgi:carboxylesterase type B